MNPIPLPWMLLGFILAVGGAGVSGYVKGGKDTGNRMKADMALTAETRRKAENEALQVAAETIVKLNVKNTTIRQKTEVITREIPVYGNCRHSPDGLRNVNEALTGEEQPTGDGELPATDAARR